MSTEELKQPEKVKTSIGGIEIEGDINDIIGNEEEVEEPITEPQEGNPDSQSFGDVPSEFASNYKNKSSAELIGELYKKQQYIGKLGNDLGKARKAEPTTANELEKLEEEELSLSARIKKLEKQIKEDFDPELDADDDGYQKLNKKKNELLKKQRELSTKRDDLKLTEKIHQEMYSGRNKELLEQKKAGVKQQLGLEEIPDEHWDTISKKAQEFAGVGNVVTDDDIQAAVIKTYGQDFVFKATSINAQQKARADIANATQKKTQVLNGKEGAITLESMTNEQIEKTIDHLEKTKQYEALAEFGKKVKTILRSKQV